MNLFHKGCRDEAAAAQAEAAAWLCRRDEGLTPEEEAEFALWLEGNPIRSQAVHRVEQTHRLLEKLTLADAERRRGPALLWPALAAAAALLLALCWPRSRPPGFEQTFASSAEAADHISLPDGSSVVLDARSAMAVAFTDKLRQVTLNRGEARFEVAKNPARPFVVIAGSVAVRAVGTVFDVRWLGKSVEVSVTEGRVQVRRDPRPEHPAGYFLPAMVVRGSRPPARSFSSPPMLVIAGERATIPLAAPIQIMPLSAPAVPQPLPLEDARLNFAHTPLAQVAEAFNRHNAVQLILADPELGDLPLVGSFAPDNVEAFVRLLEESQRMTVERRGNLIILHKVR